MFIPGDVVTESCSDEDEQASQINHAGPGTSSGATGEDACTQYVCQVLIIQDENSHDFLGRGYKPSSSDIAENENTVVLGEDSDDLASPADKPVRLLTEFEIFGPSNAYEYQGLDALHRSDLPCSQLQAAGFVSPVFLNEEDAGQEDDLRDELDLASSQQHLRTSSILQYTLDYQQMDE